MAATHEQRNLGGFRSEFSQEAGVGEASVAD